MNEKENKLTESQKFLRQAYVDRVMEWRARFKKPPEVKVIKKCVPILSSIEIDDPDYRIPKFAKGSNSSQKKEVSFVNYNTINNLFKRCAVCFGVTRPVS